MESHASVHPKRTILIFVICWLSHHKSKKDMKSYAFSSELLSLLFEAFLMFFVSSWWKQTVLCFPAPSLFAFYENRLSKYTFPNAPVSKRSVFLKTSSKSLDIKKGDKTDIHIISNQKQKVLFIWCKAFIWPGFEWQVQMSYY